MSVTPATDGKLTIQKPAVAVIWALVACLLLGASAVVRRVQDRIHNEESNAPVICPFSFDDVPRTLGRWTNTSDDMKLDSQTLRITGAKEYRIRTYKDESTGVRLVVLLLFGPLEPVVPHVPEVCYPANGFEKIDEPMNRTVRFDYRDASGKELENQPAVFRSSVYRKGKLLEGVYHSFRYKGDWTPDVGLGRDLPRRKPGVIKVQIQRLVAPGESRDGDKYPEPIEDFLKSYLPAIEERILQAEAKDLPKAEPTR